MTYDLIAIDIDGTLLTSRREVSQVTREALRRAVSAGKRVALCTGRSLNSGRAAAEQVPSSTTLVFHSGALILESLDGPLLRAVNLPRGLAADLVDFCKRRGHDPLVYEPVPESRYIWFEHPRSANGWRERYLEANADKAFQVDALEQVLSRDPAQIAVAGRGSSMHELKAELAEYGDRIGVILSRSTLVGDYWCMEIVPAGVSKAKALAFLGERYGIGPGRMISIGDNFNDLDMIEYAGLGVAMGNAPDAVRRAADLVAPANDADGVAHIIDTCLL